MHQVIDLHTERVTALAFSPCGTEIISGDSGGNVSIDRFPMVRHLEMLRVDSPVTFIAIDRLNRMMFVAHQTGVTKFTRDQSKIWKKDAEWFRERSDATTDYVTISPDRNEIAAYSLAGSENQKRRHVQLLRSDRLVSLRPAYDTPGYLYLPHDCQAVVRPMGSRTVLKQLSKAAPLCAEFDEPIASHELCFTSPGGNYIIAISELVTRTYTQPHPSERPSPYLTLSEIGSNSVEIRPAALAFTSSDAALYFTGKTKTDHSPILVDAMHGRYGDIGGSNFTPDTWFPPLAVDFSAKHYAHGVGNLVLLSAMPTVWREGND